MTVWIEHTCLDCGTTWREEDFEDCPGCGPEHTSSLRRISEQNELPDDEMPGTSVHTWETWS